MSIAVKTATGAAWHLGAGVGVRGLGLVGTLLLTRFLAPHEYGEVLLGAACVMVVARVMTLGTSPYVIARQTDPDDSFQAIILQCGLTAVGVAGVVAAREPLSVALNAPGMVRYLPGLALAAFVAQLSSVPAAILTRSLRFSVPAVARLAGEATYTVVSVSLAPLLGGMALVAGNLARSFVSTTLVLLRSNPSDWWRPGPPRWRAMRDHLTFGLPLTGGSIAQTVSGYGDNMLVSRLYGPAVMGQYNLGFNVATTPTAYVADYAGDVLLPGLSAVPEGQRRTTALLRSLALVCLIVYPLAFGLAVVAPTLVAAILDPRWAPVAPMMTILSGIAVARTVSSVSGPYLLASGRPRTIFMLGWLRAGSLVILLLTLGRLGPLWACAAATLAAGLGGAGALLVLSRRDGPTLRQLLAAMAPATLAALGMVLAVLGARSVLGAFSVPLWLALLAEVVVGAVAYLILARVLGARHVVDLLGIMRELVRRRATPGSMARP